MVTDFTHCAPPISRRFCTPGAQRNRYGYQIPYISTSKEGKHTVTGGDDRLTPELKTVMSEQFEFESLEPDKAEPSVAYFTPDGV